MGHLRRTIEAERYGGEGGWGPTVSTVLDAVLCGESRGGAPRLCGQPTPPAGERKDAVAPAPTYCRQSDRTT
jgi:hypothetical protein